MKNIKKFRTFVNENNESKSDLDKMMAEIDSEIKVDDWLDPEEVQVQAQAQDPDAVGDEYIVEIGAGNKDADKVDK